MLLVPDRDELATLAHAQVADSADAVAMAIDPRPIIRHYILQNFLFTDDPAALDDGDSFLQLGIIDSVGALEIALFLEQTFGFTVKEEEMLPDNLDSVARLARFVESRCRGG